MSPRAVSPDGLGGRLWRTVPGPHRDPAVEPSGPQQGGVEDPGPVGRRRTITASVGPNPSISVKIWSSVCSRSSLLPVTRATCSGRALRIETVINKPVDIGVLARLEHLPELVAKARGVNDRLLMIERAGQVCAIGSALFERIHQPYVREGQRTGAFRFGDQRAMALAGSLCLVVHAVTAFTNKNLRGQVAGLLGRDYSSSQMSYDLRRLRLLQLIERSAGTNSYTLTADGTRVAVFYTKLHARLLRPLLSADRPPAPVELRHALATVQHFIDDYVANARLGAAA